MFSGEETLSDCFFFFFFCLFLFFCISSEKGSNLKEKNLLQILSFYNRPLFRRDLMCRKSHRKLYKLSPIAEIVEISVKFP